jgi:hypothetical protein
MEHLPAVLPLVAVVEVGQVAMILFLWSALLLVDLAQIQGLLSQ